MSRIGPIWQAVVRSFAPDPVRPSCFLETLTIPLAVLYIAGAALGLFGMITGQWFTRIPRDDIFMRVLGGITQVVAIACWAGVIANIRAARWAALGLIVVPVMLLLADILIAREYWFLWILLFHAPFVAVVAGPLFVRRRPTQ